MSYVHPDDRNLTNLHKAMDYNTAGQPLVRTRVDNTWDDPVPVSLGSNTITITGNVVIPATVNVTSSTENPVHVHASEVGTSGILDVPWMPIAGNVTIDSGNVTVQQGTTPWVTNATVVGTVALGSMPDVAVTAFEEPLAVGITPVNQADAVYGLDPDYWNTSELRGGNVSVENSTWQVASGTSAGGYARLASSRYVTYHAGQGVMFRWTAAFTTTGGTTRDALGIDNIVQNTGPIDREDGYSIGYSGSTLNDASRRIGILHRRGGKAETRKLTITTAPTGTQTATITLDGVAYTVTVTNSASTAYTATQIATLLNANATARNTWDIEACGNIVTFSYYSPGARNGTYSFSSTGIGTLAVGTFTRLVAGAAPNDTWIYVADWNGTVPSFDPTKLNVFGMDMRWLGAGRVRFFMEDPATGKFLLIHTLKYTSTQQTPHTINPSMRIVYRSGTTNTAITPSQNVIVRGASVFGGVQGDIVQTSGSQGYYAVNGTGFTKDDVHHLMSIQNPFVRSNQINKSSLVIQDLTVSQQGQDPSVIFIIKNAVGTSGYLVFNPIPGTNPFMFAQYSVSAVTENIELDTLSNIQTLGINGSARFDLKEYNLELAPGEYISVFITSAAPISRTSVGMTWRVD